MLKGHMEDGTEMFNLKKEKIKNLDHYDTIIIGGSIHAGKIQRRMKLFCEKNREQLLSKKLGLYLCCMEEGDTAHQQFDNAYSKELRQHAMATGLFGGEFDFDRMGALAKTIVKKVAKTNDSVSKLHLDRIEDFAAKMR